MFFHWIIYCTVYAAGVLSTQPSCQNLQLVLLESQRKWRNWRFWRVGWFSSWPLWKLLSRSQSSVQSIWCYIQRTGNKAQTCVLTYQQTLSAIMWYEFLIMSSIQASGQQLLVKLVAKDEVEQCFNIAETKKTDHSKMTCWLAINKANARRGNVFHIIWNM